MCVPVYTHMHLHFFRKVHAAHMADSQRLVCGAEKTKNPWVGCPPCSNIQSLTFKETSAEIQLVSCSFLALRAVSITLNCMKERKLNLRGWCSQLPPPWMRKQSPQLRPAHQRVLSAAIRLPFKLSSRKEDISHLNPQPILLEFSNLSPLFSKVSDFVPFPSP